MLVLQILILLLQPLVLFRRLIIQTSLFLQLKLVHMIILLCLPNLLLQKLYSILVLIRLTKLMFNSLDLHLKLVVRGVRLLELVLQVLYVINHVLVDLNLSI